MYGFPSVDKLRPIVGQQLNQIACTINQLIFDFSGNSSIVCETDFRFVRSDGREGTISIPLADTTLMGLLESSVVDVTETGNDRLVISFSTYDKLVFQDRPAYESFQIVIEGHEFIV